MPKQTKIKMRDFKKDLKAAKATWKPRRDLTDRQMLPVYRTGAKKRAMRVAAKIPAVRFKRVLQPTGNPMLFERRVRRKLVDEKARKLRPGKKLPMGAAAPSPAAGATPTSVNWRVRWGWPWITTVRDQNGCNACWAFGAVALVEAMTRIEHCVWTTRSEGDVHKGMGAVCADLGGSGTALNWMRDHGGVADPDCFAWTTANIAYSPTPDRSGRTVRIGDHTPIGSINDQKTWLDTVGPLVVWLDVWTDFFGYGSGVYRKSNATWNNFEGGHLMLAVGYDDNQGCWIVKNSWGSGWGENGYCRIAYGECKIDTYAKLGLQLTNPDPWTKRLQHNGVIIESGNGAHHRNFEMVATAGSRSLQQWWRNNSAPGFPWKKAYPRFANDVKYFPTLTATTYNRNFELVYVTLWNRLHHWWFNQRTKKWCDGGVFGPSDAHGVPGFIQGNYGAPGNFEVVVATNDGRLNHWWRQNGPPWKWSDGGRFGKNVAMGGATLLQSKYGNKGNFEFVCVLKNGKMQHWWRDNDHGMKWKPSVTFGAGISSPPVMIEASYGAENETAIGNFELCVARRGRVEHWWRNNSGSGKWTRSTMFGRGVKQVVGLLQGSFGFNLEVIVLRTDKKLQHYWRDGAGWHAGVIIGSA